MSEATSGRTVTEIRAAHRLHEALVIKLAPEHDVHCASRVEGHRCDCDFISGALFAQTIGRHAPTETPHSEPCPTHQYNRIMLSVPGFRCDDCKVALGLTCRGCGAAWPCADVRVASNATGLDVPEAVDHFLATLAPAS